MKLIFRTDETRTHIHRFGIEKRNVNLISIGLISHYDNLLVSLLYDLLLWKQILEYKEKRPIFNLMSN